MPNYNDRRYHSENLRREADGLMERHGVNPRTLPHIHALLDAADKYDTMNDRRGYEHDDESPEMRRGRSGRNMRGEHEDHMEMRRGRSGRYVRGAYEDEMNNRYDPTYPDAGSILPRDPYGPYMGGGTREKKTPQMGFTAVSGRKDKGTKLLDDIEQYWGDFSRHAKAYAQTQDAQEAQHAKLELVELAEYLEEFIEFIGQHAHTPETKQVVQQMKQKISSMP